LPVIALFEHIYWISTVFHTVYSHVDAGSTSEATERPSIDKMTLAEMESVIKADLEKRDKEKQDKYQEPLDSQKEKGR